MKKNKNNLSEKPFKVTKEGSLGLLAFGDIGLTEWRKVKSELRKKDELDEKK